MALDINEYPALLELVARMTAANEYPKDELIARLESATISERVIKLMDRQAKPLAWHEYRALFINPKRITQGVAFWHEWQPTLARAEREWGVPVAIIVALLGIETNYGATIGSTPVLDSLVTLTAAYPRRSQFFGKELRSFLKLTRDPKNIPPAAVGSYAGAIGIPQFMPTSYVAYAVDFNNNQQIDLIDEVEDAIGSVANYLGVHGWQRDRAIYAAVDTPLPAHARTRLTRKIKPTHRTQDLLAAGIEFDATRSSEHAALLTLTEHNGERHIVGYQNFYAISRYNPNLNYTMAVASLAEAITEAK